MQAKNQGRTNGKPGRAFIAALLALLFLLNTVTLGAYAKGDVPEEPTDDLSSAVSSEIEEAAEEENWVTLGAEKEPLHSAFWKEGDLSGEELASAVLSPQTLPAFLSPEKAEERGHVKRLTAQQPDADTVIFQNRDGSKTLYCPVGSVSDVLTQPESRTKDGVKNSALEQAVQKKYGLKAEQIGAVYTENDMAVVEYSEIGGDYYINCYGSAKFLNCGGVRADITTGTTAQMGNAAVFKLQFNKGIGGGENEGYYYIHPYADTSIYLQYSNTALIKPVTYSSSSATSDLAHWQLVEDGSMYRIVNKVVHINENNQKFKYSFYSNSSVFTCSAEQADEDPDGRRWRLLDKDTYQANELTGFTLSTYEVTLAVNGSGRLQIRTTPSAPLLATGNEFRMNTQEGHIVNSTSNGKVVLFAGLEMGVAEVEVVHVPSGMKAGKVSLRVSPGSGQYKLRNRAADNYLSSLGSDLYLREHYSQDTARTFTITAASNGYFYIKNSTGLYLTSRIDATVRFEAKKTDPESQLWFYSGADGTAGTLSCKMRPQVVLNAIPGGVVILSAYSEDEDFHDEWILLREEQTTLGLPGNESGDTMMKRVSRTSNLALRKIPFVYPNVYRYIDSDLGLAAMREGPVVLFNTHGFNDRILMTHKLSGESESALTMEQVKVLPDGAFSNTKLVVYIACLTAEGGASADNLFKATVDKGAEIVIGFSNVIKSTECDFWNEEFCRALSEKCSVSEAIQRATQYAIKNSGTSTMRKYLVTSGNLNQFVYNYG